MERYRGVSCSPSLCVVMWLLCAFLSITWPAAFYCMLVLVSAPHWLAHDCRAALRSYDGCRPTARPPLPSQISTVSAVCTVLCKHPACLAPLRGNRYVLQFCLLVSFGLILFTACNNMKLEWALSRAHTFAYHKIGH